MLQFLWPLGQAQSDVRVAVSCISERQRRGGFNDEMHRLREENRWVMVRSIDDQAIKHRDRSERRAHGEGGCVCFCRVCVCVCVSVCECLCVCRGGGMGTGVCF